jgi:hypothetical protein
MYVTGFYHKLSGSLVMQQECVQIYLNYFSQELLSSIKKLFKKKKKKKKKENKT